jgi:hypothetical protein
VVKRVLLPVLFAGLGIACTRTASIPDPKATADAWAEAAEKGDSEALYGMLTKRSQATMSKTEVARTVASSRAELKEQAAGIKATKAIVAVALVRWDDGTEASLTLENGQFHVNDAVMMPGGGATPEETVAGFRSALKRRSYPAMVRMLTPALRATVEAQLEGIGRAIAEPDKISYPTGTGDEMEIKLENGHKLRLKKVDKKWYIDNFE